MTYDLKKKTVHFAWVSLPRVCVLSVGMVGGLDDKLLPLIHPPIKVFFDVVLQIMSKYCSVIAFVCFRLTEFNNGACSLAQGSWTIKNESWSFTTLSFSDNVKSWFRFYCLNQRNAPCHACVQTQIPSMHVRCYNLRFQAARWTIFDICFVTSFCAPEKEDPVHSTCSVQRLVSGVLFFWHTHNYI